jgi:hypothetical protein
LVEGYQGVLPTGLSKLEKQKPPLITGVLLTKSKSSQRFSHRPHLNLNNPRVVRLRARQQRRGCHIFRLEHHGGCHTIFGTSFADGKFGFDPTWADHTNFDAVRSQFFIQRLGKSNLGEFGGAVHGFACKSIMPAMLEIMMTVPDFWAIMLGTR